MEIDYYISSLLIASGSITSLVIFKLLDRNVKLGIIFLLGIISLSMYIESYFRSQGLNYVFLVNFSLGFSMGKISYLDNDNELPFPYGNIFISRCIFWNSIVPVLVSTSYTLKYFLPSICSLPLFISFPSVISVTILLSMLISIIFTYFLIKLKIILKKLSINVDYIKIEPEQNKDKRR